MTPRRRSSGSGKTAGQKGPRSSSCWVYGSVCAHVHVGVRAYMCACVKYACELFANSMKEGAQDPHFGFPCQVLNVAHALWVWCSLAGEGQWAIAGTFGRYVLTAGPPTHLACRGQILTRHVAENATAQLCIVQRLEGPVSTASWWPWGTPRAHQVLT